MKNNSYHFCSSIYLFIYILLNINENTFFFFLDNMWVGRIWTLVQALCQLRYVLLANEVPFREVISCFFNICLSFLTMNIFYFLCYYFGIITHLNFVLLTFLWHLNSSTTEGTREGMQWDYLYITLWLCSSSFSSIYTTLSLLKPRKKVEWRKKTIWKTI